MFPSFKPFPNKPWLLRVCSTSVLKTQWEKEKLLVTSNFSFSRGVFYLLGEVCAIFNKYEIVVCKLFQFWKSLKFVVWERVNYVRLLRTIWEKEKMLVTRLFSPFATMLILSSEITFII